MRRRIALIALAFLISCSKATTPVAGGTGSPSLSANPSGSAVSVGTPSSVVGSSNVPTGTTTIGPPPPAPKTNTPPDAGTYTYNQQGSAKVAGFEVAFDPTGTLQIDKASKHSDGEHQNQKRAYTSNNTRDQELIFRANGVYLSQVVSHAGGQTLTCTLKKPILAVIFPMKTGATWHDASTCGDQSLDIQGSIKRVENRTVQGQSMTTVVVHAVVKLDGGGYSSTSTLDEWVSPAYRLIVHATEDSEGSYSGAPFTSHLTEDLQSVSPK